MLGTEREPGDVLGAGVPHDEDVVLPVAAGPGRRGTALFTTLATYLRHGTSKTATTSALHLPRQGLYQRLGRIFEIIGEPVPGSAEYGALLVAVELETARRAARE